MRGTVCVGVTCAARCVLFIKQNDKIGFKIDADGKLVTDIAKGHKLKKAA